jgi:hypothetical protein
MHRRSKRTSDVTKQCFINTYTCSTQHVYVLMKHCFVRAFTCVVLVVHTHVYALYMCKNCCGNSNTKIERATIRMKHMYICMYIHTYMHTYIHTYIHIHIYNIHVSYRGSFAQTHAFQSLKFGIHLMALIHMYI